MTRENDNSVYLIHIRDAIAKIEEYLNKTNKQDFPNNTLIQDGLIRQIEIIGEAVKNLSATLRGQNTHIPWKDIAGMRDKLIHMYFGVDIEAVWNTVNNDIPKLKQEISKLLS